MFHGWCSRCRFTGSTFLLRQARAAPAWIFRCCKLLFAAADPIVISAAELVYLGDLAQNMLSHVPGLMMQSEAGNKNVRVEMENYMSLDMTTAVSFGLSCHLEMGDSRLRRFELERWNRWFKDAWRNHQKEATSLQGIITSSWRKLHGP